MKHPHMMRVGTYSSNSPYKTDNTTSVISNATLDDIYQSYKYTLLILIYLVYNSNICTIS
jgi:hypothetical protein